VLLAADPCFVAKLSVAPSLSTQLLLAAITVGLGVNVLFALCAMLARDTELPAPGKETDYRYNFHAGECDARRFFLDFHDVGNTDPSTPSSQVTKRAARPHLDTGTIAVLGVKEAADDTLSNEGSWTCGAAATARSISRPASRRDKLRDVNIQAANVPSASSRSLRHVIDKQTRVSSSLIYRCR
jgi:hypothetical protein